MLSHEQRYEAAWADLRWRGRAVLVVLAALVPSVGLLALLLIYTPLNPNYLLWVPPLWGVVLIGAVINRSMFPCPRCGGAFFLANPLAGSCMHCGLKIGEPYSAPHVRP